MPERKDVARADWARGGPTKSAGAKNESFHKFHPALTSIFLVNLTCLRTR